jgi:nicotinamide riboside transporter PnuC
MSEQVVMRKELLRESGRQMLVSLVLYGVLFGVLYVVEIVCPSLRGTLLQWSNAAFVVGIPASVIGTAYVLTIRNPKNYIGFYGDIVMAVLLAVQFWLQGSLDLTLLYLAVFVPFGIFTLLNWRSNTLHPALQVEPFAPRWLPRGGRWLSLVAALVIVALDYVLATLWIQHNGFGENVLQKLMGGVMIASSVLANVLLIRQRIDAWIWWVVYSLAGMVLYVLVGNIFSLVLFVVFLVVNGSTGWTWIRRYGMCK